jgi:hypothetical protein
MTALPDDQPRYSEGDLAKFRAGAHAADARQYLWLADALRRAGQKGPAEHARLWAVQHERLAYQLLGLKGRQR